MPLDGAGSTGVLIAGAVRHADLYAGYFASHPRAHVVGVVQTPATPDWAHGRAERLAADLGVAYEDDLAQALKGRDVDAVCVCTGPHEQARVARQAAAAGKHLWLDQPLAFELADARELAVAVERAGVVAGVGSRLFAPAVQAARLAIDNGRIGLPWGFQVEFLVVTTACQQFAEHLAPAFTRGDLLRLGGFPVADILYLSGLRVVTVQAFSGARFFEGHQGVGLDDFTVIALGLERGGQATIAVGRVPMVERGLAVDGVLRVRGSKGTLAFTEEQPALRVWGRGGVHARVLDSRWPDRPQAGRLEERLVGDAIDDFVRAVHGERRPALGMADAVAVLEVLLAAGVSAAESRVVNLALEPQNGVLPRTTGNSRENGR